MLQTTSEWLTPSGEALLTETTTYTFSAETNASATRSIERTTKLTVRLLLTYLSCSHCFLSRFSPTFTI